MIDRLREDITNVERTHGGRITGLEVEQGKQGERINSLEDRQDRTDRAIERLADGMDGIKKTLSDGQRSLNIFLIGAGLTLLGWLLSPLIQHVMPKP
jgi:hypothetical protein